MNSVDLIAPIVTGVGVASFASIFTIMYRTYANSAVADYKSGQCDVELIGETILENIERSKTVKKVFGIIKKVLFGILLAILIPALLMSVYSKVADGIAMVGGRGVIAVASGSMSEKNAANPYLAGYDNQFDTYDMIVLQKVESSSELQIYDVIAFRDDTGKNVIHRIVGFKATSSGLRYITRGDSNNADDQYAPSFDDVLGEYTGQRIPLAGVFVMFLQSFSGIVTILAIIYCLIMIEIVRNKIETAREDRLILLQETIDFKTETNPDIDTDAAFVETVYFKDYAYTFNKDGFVSKEIRSADADATVDTHADAEENELNISSTEADTDGEEEPKNPLQKFGAWLFSKLFVAEDDDDDEDDIEDDDDDDDDDEDSRPNNKKVSRKKKDAETDDGEKL